MRLTKDQLPELNYIDIIKHLRRAKENPEQYSFIVEDLKEELIIREPTLRYRCTRCGYSKHHETQLRASGGALSSFFDVQTEGFRVISCRRCNHSELFQSDVAFNIQLLDFLISN